MSHPTGDGKALNDRLALEYPGSEHIAGAPYAILETNSTAVRSAAKKPRGHGYETGALDKAFTEGNRPFPNTGNAFTADQTGKLTPEWAMQNPTLSAGVDSLGSAQRHCGSGMPMEHRTRKRE